MPLQRFVTAMAVLVCIAEQLSALTINLDFTHDRFIEDNPAAKASIEAAAVYLSDVITSELESVADPIFGSWGETQVTLDWFFVYTNPTSLVSEFVNNVSLDQDEVRIFVGGAVERSDALAVGGPALPGFDAFVNGPGGDFPRALSIAEATVNDTLGRGNGPTILTQTGNPSYLGVPGSYEFGIGANYGWLYFDVDFNNDGTQDSDQQLEDAWHFDHLSPVPEDKYDFYTIALHEMLHSLGFGPGESYFELAMSGDWAGGEVASLVGDVQLSIDATGHVDGFPENSRISDGKLQEPLMGPRIRPGVRKEITLLDLAFLRDLGFTTAIEGGSFGDFHHDTILDINDLDLLVAEIASGDPEQQFDVNGDDVIDNSDVSLMLARIAEQNGILDPYFRGDVNLDGIVNAQDLNRLALNWTREVTGWSSGDVFPDGVIDALDLNVLAQRWLESNSAALAAQGVPEPQAIWMGLGAALFCCSFLRRAG